MFSSIWLDNESDDAARLFWELAGEIEAFPRSLGRAVALALPVALVKLPRLQLNDVKSWLGSRCPRFNLTCQSRPIHGCLVAFAGKGIAFLDGSDQPEELRFTLAHEISHFMLDYWLSRRELAHLFGQSILEVLDGLRLPSVRERMHAIVAGQEVVPYVSFLARNQAEPTVHVWRIEDRADRLALALLAPSESVMARVDVSSLHYAERLEAVHALLRNCFGLSPSVSRTYAAALLDEYGHGPSWAESLRLR